MKERVSFKLPVYKDQGQAGNYGVLIAINDVVSLVIHNDGGAQTLQDVTLTGVFEGGKTIEWDYQATPLNQLIKTYDVVRVHKKHQWNCPGPQNWSATIAESGGGTAAPLSVGTVTLSGVTYNVNVTEAATGAGITPAFVQAVVDKLNSLLGSEGFATGTVAGLAGSQTLAIRINDTTLNWTAITVPTGGTVTVQPIVV